MVDRPDLKKFVNSLKVPFIGTGRSASGAATGICEDDEAIGALAAEYLLGRGFKHFACYRTDAGEAAILRERSFSKAVKKAKSSVKTIAGNRFRVRGERNWSNYTGWLAGELAALPRPVAVFCIDDRMALGVIDACMQHGIRIPDEVAVLGVGNLEIACECSAVPISSIRIDFESLGYEAAKLLDRVLNGESLPAKPVLLAPEGIEERRTTYTLAIESPAGSRALRYMLDHLATPISISEVAQAGGLTLRQLSYITQKHLGMAPARLLEDLRFTNACEILRSTDQKVATIARRCGLGTALRLQRIFRKRYKTTPSAWRRASHPLIPQMPHNAVGRSG